MASTQHYGQVVDLYEADGVHFAKIYDLQTETAHLADLGTDVPDFAFGSLVAFQPDDGEVTAVERIGTDELPADAPPLVEPEYASNQIEAWLASKMEPPEKLFAIRKAGEAFRSRNLAVDASNVLAALNTMDFNFSRYMIDALNAAHYQITAVTGGGGSKAKVPDGAYVLIDQLGQMTSVRVKRGDIEDAALIKTWRDALVHASPHIAEIIGVAIVGVSEGHRTGADKYPTQQYVPPVIPAGVFIDTDKKRRG